MRPMLPIMIALAVLGVAPQSPSVHCVFRRTTSTSVLREGSCGRLSPASAITTGRWRSDVRPNAVWAGDITDRAKQTSPLELETYTESQAGIAGILRTENGWYPVLRYRESADSLVLDIDTTRTVGPSALDRAIIERADAILSSTTIWNRADTRECPAGAPTVSIYCAMTRASMEVTGGIHHRRPAMQIVREIVDKRSAGRNYSHRLMDYNNDPRTTLGDVHSLFAEALAGQSRKSAGASVLAGRPSVPGQSLAIVARAQSLIATSDKWNRAETQECAADAKTFGLYCALRRAVVDVTGQSDDQNSVFGDAREVVDSVSSKKYSARLLDYNNDPTTTFEDIQAFFRILQNRVAFRLER